MDIPCFVRNYFGGGVQHETKIYRIVRVENFPGKHFTNGERMQHLVILVTYIWHFLDKLDGHA